jgi:hypothetical protein
VKPTATSRRDPGATSRRDAGLALISRINRWMVAGTVALAGVISIAAKASFHGHSRTVASSNSQGSQASGSSSSASGTGLQQPSQTPAVAPSAPVVVSGGS